MIQYCWLYPINSISINLYHQINRLINIKESTLNVTIGESMLMSQFWWIYTDGLILMNLLKRVNIEQWILRSWYGLIYPDKSILMHLHQRFINNSNPIWDTDISTPMRTFWQIEPVKLILMNLIREFILMNLTNRVDIEEWSLMGQYGQIYPYDSILTNLQKSVDIDEPISTGWYCWICTEDSILKDLPWWVNINEPTLTNWYQHININKSNQLS